MKKELLKFFVLLVVAIGAGPATGAFWQWSRTASSNGNSDPSINWTEGMPPSVVNDSARAMMARLAEQFADTSGALVTAGGPTAYTVTTTQGFPNPPNDGQVIGVTFNVSSSASPTLSVDGGTAYAIASQQSVPASVVSGVPYTMTYNAATTAWILRGGGAGGNIPLGGIVAYTGTTVPSPNFVFANGQCLSTGAYSVYWAFIGSPAPGPCSAGYFQVIDLRGFVVAGLDTMPGNSAAGRLTSAGLGCGTSMTVVGAACPNGSESRVLTLAQMPVHSHTATDSGHTHTVGVPQTTTVGTGGASVNAGTITNVTTSTGFANISVSNAGSGQAFPSLPPIAGVNYIIRVL